MAIRLVDAGWGEELTDGLRADASELKIICPFIKSGALDRLLSKRLKSIQVITRFNLGDFAEGVSDIAALRKLLEADASIRGVRNLHAKLYLFGTSRAIVTSANLTEAAINRNHEFGMVAEDRTIVATCRGYFASYSEVADLDQQMLEVVWMICFNAAVITAERRYNKGRKQRLSVVLKKRGRPRRPDGRASLADRSTREARRR